MRDLAANEKVAFMIHTGDICYENGLKNHIKLMNTSNMGCPVFYCLGNHDLVKGKYGEELFESIYGPVYYSFDFGSTHYIVTPIMLRDFGEKMFSAGLSKIWHSNRLENQLFSSTMIYGVRPISLFLS